ncbi:FAD-dependent oxidoreductase [Streptomyces kebangsaanensis]|uniref:FAD-dependent oxidoreductase n=1 Tax=Streptomyces kebangsaanensis TaxID=864058 RepID=A0ABW6KT74_9ACTN
MAYRDVRTVLVVGAGAIGTSWAAHLLRQGLDVVLVDPDRPALERARTLAAAFIEEGDGPADTLDHLTTTTEVEACAPAADLVIEAGPEVLDVKRDLFGRLDSLTGVDVLLTSSSSGLPPSSFAGAAGRHPERVLVAHPFNPPHLVPLVELVGAPTTAEGALRAADAFFTGVGKRCITLRTELPGHVVNRLQAALWREAYDLVGRGVVSVADIDTAIAWGPGLRWALLGPFATQHLSGGAGGIAHILEHLGPPTVEWWKDLGDPSLTSDLREAIVAGMTEEMDTIAQDEDGLRARRDAALRGLIRAKEEAGLP